MPPEPRSADAELEPFENDDQDDLDMRDGTEDFTDDDDGDDSNELKPTNRDVLMFDTFCD